MLNIRCEAFPYGKRRHIFYCSSIIFQVFVCAFSKFHFIMIDWIMNIVWFCPRTLSFAHAWGSIFWSGRIHFMPGIFYSRSQDLLGCRKYGGCLSIWQNKMVDRLICENQVVSICCVCGYWFLSDHQASEEFCGLWSVRNRFMRVCSMTFLVVSTSGSVDFSLL